MVTIAKTMKILAISCMYICMSVYICTKKDHKFDGATDYRNEKSSQDSQIEMIIADGQH